MLYFFIIEEVKETILDFPQRTVKVSLISIGFNANLEIIT